MTTTIKTRPFALLALLLASAIVCTLFIGLQEVSAAERVHLGDFETREACDRAGQLEVDRGYFRAYRCPSNGGAPQYRATTWALLMIR